jgi:hypothetical protein
MLRISHCLDNRLTVNCEILATCCSTYGPVRTSQEAHSVKIIKFLTLSGLELWPLSRPARSQSLYHLHYPGFLPSYIGFFFKCVTEVKQQKFIWIVFSYKLPLSLLSENLRLWWLDSDACRRWNRLKFLPLRVAVEKDKLECLGQTLSP